MTILSKLAISHLLAGAKIIWIYSCEGLRMTPTIFIGIMGNGAHGRSSAVIPCLLQFLLYRGDRVAWIFLQLQQIKMPLSIRHGTAKSRVDGNPVEESSSVNFGTFKQVFLHPRTVAPVITGIGDWSMFSYHSIIIYQIAHLYDVLNISSYNRNDTTPPLDHHRRYFYTYLIDHEMERLVGIE